MPGCSSPGQVNVMAHIWAARALLPAMNKRGDGYLLSSASAAGLLTQLSALAYSATKHAAVAVAEWLAITYWRRRNQGVLPLPDEVADAVVAGTSDERFLILPQADVAKCCRS